MLSRTAGIRTANVASRKLHTSAVRSAHKVSARNSNEFHPSLYSTPRASCAITSYTRADSFSYSYSQDLLFGNQGRTALLAGVEVLAKAVSVTLGPKGRNVIIEQAFGGPKVRANRQRPLPCAELTCPRCPSDHQGRCDCRQVYHPQGQIREPRRSVRLRSSYYLSACACSFSSATTLSVSFRTLPTEQMSRPATEPLPPPFSLALSIPRVSRT